MDGDTTTHTARALTLFAAISTRASFNLIPQGGNGVPGLFHSARYIAL